MILGIDVGTQSLKAALLDSGFRLAGGSSRVYQPSYPRPGWVEQEPSLWTDALAPAIAEALAAAHASPRDVRAVGICGQLDGCIAVDSEGKPLSTCLTWMDRRATAEIADIPPDLIRAECGLVLDPSHLAAKARWLVRNLPKGVKVARFHQPVSYMVEQLTGTAVMDHALASTSMVYSLDQRGYDAALLDRFELSAARLPPIAAAEQRAGRLGTRGAALTGLPQGIPVAVGTGDDFATPLGAGLNAPGKVVAVLGTGEVVGGLHPTPKRDECGLLETHAYPGGAFFIENPGWFSGGAVTWLARLLEIDARSFDDLATDIPPGSDGLAFLPALTGAMAPEWRPSARGCFYGFTPSHGRGHMVRALFEGCAFAMRDVVDRLDAMGVATESLLLLGGGAHSSLWPRMRADIVRRPAEVPECVDSAPVGAALLGAVAGGVVGSLDEAIRLLPIRSTVIQPDPRCMEAYEAAYQTYRLLFSALKPLFAPN